MANSVGLSPVAQARVELTQARENLNTRLDSSRKLVTAFENVSGQSPEYFEQQKGAIKQLVVRTDALGNALTTLEQAGVDAGSCKITVPGKLFGTKKVERPVVEVQKEIQSNLDQDVVKVGLRTLGIVEEPTKSRFSLPEAPSSRSVAKGLAAVVGAVCAVTAGVRREEIYQAVEPYVTGAVNAVEPYVTGAVNAVKAQLPDCTATPDSYICKAYSALPTSAQVQGVLTHPATIGVGVAVAIVGAVAIAKVIKNRRNQQAEAAAAAQALVETPVEANPKAKIA